jgi:hypothetical protein
MVTPKERGRVKLFNKPEEFLRKLSAYMSGAISYIPAHMTGSNYIKHVHVEDVDKFSITLKLLGGTQKTCCRVN